MSDIWIALGLESEPGGGPDTIVVRKNSGANVGTQPRLNFIEGSNIALTVADDGVDGEIDITIAATGGSASVAFASAEADLGSLPRYSGSFDITGLTGLTADMPVLVWQAVGPYTGKGDATGSIDEAEMDQVSATGYVLSTTAIRVFWTCPPKSGPMAGNVKFKYLVGA